MKIPGRNRRRGGGAGGISEMGGRCAGGDAGGLVAVFSSMASQLSTARKGPNDSEHCPARVEKKSPSLPFASRPQSHLLFGRINGLADNPCQAEDMRWFQNRAVVAVNDVNPRHFPAPMPPAGVRQMHRVLKTQRMAESIRLLDFRATLPEKIEFQRKNG